MDGDRGVVLAIDAAVEGIVDFREARLLDVHWWRRLRVVLEGLARRKRQTVLEASYRMYLSQLSNGSLTSESFDRIQQLAVDRFYDLVGTIKPWEGSTSDERKHREIADWKSDYIEATGWDPSDPEFLLWEAEKIKESQQRQAHLERDAQNDPLQQALRRMREKRESKQRQGRQ